MMRSEKARSLVGSGSKRACSILGLAWACLESAARGRTEHRPTSADWPETVVKRITFQAGGGHPWRLSALTSPRHKPAPWRILVITGSPSWAEYWAEAIAALPPDREMIVVDRPGFAASEPAECVPDIRVQAEALSPLLAPRRGQRVLIVGQSYGAAIATLMAAGHPARVHALALLSSYLGVPGPTARWLTAMGARFLSVIPRDLRNAVSEIESQAVQMPLMVEALKRVRAPVHMIHGDKDDFAPIETAERLAKDVRAAAPIRFQAVAGANHFLTSGPAEELLAALEGCLPPARVRPPLRWPEWARWPERQAGLALNPSAAQT
ncbi:MAG TPA: alpha/beta hydrolase [Caulobacteraceae bacterium]|nr:alpha/beta hydrolase [Caulobacteraceae bacterium]